ncbi:LysR family transcriptional regulator [Roseomonas sp. OT10]|uniref:LysR family transcriptional regulator n=1 Tax=Roseomonas cutis TaxID=2897332 RepID=UPI001E4A0209|nr:LysR family transcriptional regulator [Roseomonas sp. OT10]UFN50191.1 LysR family transcriptional regulator [Roseomonas sp. OT10]
MLPRALLYMDAIARAGSVRKAAQRLNVAASAVNRQLLDLEQELGVELFERLPRGMRATAAGETLLAHIRRQRRDFEATRQQLEALRGLRRGRVRIAAHESATRDIVPRAVARLRAEHPRVTYEVRMANAAHITAALLDDSVELGLVFNPVPDPALRQLAQVQAPLHAILPAGHPLAGHDGLRLAECLEYPVALTVAPDGMATGGRALVEALVQRSSLSLEPALETDSFDLMARFAREAGGVFFQIAAGVAPELRRGDLVAVPLREPSLARGRLTLLARRDRTLSALAARCAEHLAEEMRQAPERSENPHPPAGN